MIYVDQFPGNGWGRWQGGGHLLTSDISELHSLAIKIGLKVEWYQLKTCPHYDLTASKRKLAIKHGAKEIELGEFPDDMLWIAPGSKFGTFETTRERRHRKKSGK